MDGVNQSEDGGDDEFLDGADVEANLDEEVLTAGALIAAEQDGPAPLPALPESAIARARGYASASRAASTRTKYEAAWDSFAQWCAAHGHAALPPTPARSPCSSPRKPGAACRRPG